MGSCAVFGSHICLVFSNFWQFLSLYLPSGLWRAWRNLLNAASFRLVCPLRPTGNQGLPFLLASCRVTRDVNRSQVILSRLRRGKSFHGQRPSYSVVTDRSPFLSPGEDWWSTAHSPSWPSSAVSPVRVSPTAMTTWLPAVVLNGNPARPCLTFYSGAFWGALIVDWFWFRRDVRQLFSSQLPLEEASEIRKYRHSRQVRISITLDAGISTTLLSIPKDTPPHTLILLTICCQTILSLSFFPLCSRKWAVKFQPVIPCDLKKHIPAPSPFGLCLSSWRPQGFGLVDSSLPGSLCWPRSWIISSWGEKPITVSYD